MFDFLVRKNIVKSAQKYIDSLNPKVNIHVPEDLPLPSIGLLKKMASVVSKINGLESAMEKLSDQELKNKTVEFKARYEKDILTEKKAFLDLQARYRMAKTRDEKEALSLEIEKAQTEYRKRKQVILGEMLPEAFAVVREAGRRILNMRHYDVQLVGGMVLNSGSIAEMTTGEGKTLVATLPAYLNALTGDGVHVVTVNDYLARRDREWMGPLYEFLGLKLGVIQHDMYPQDRQGAYACDITYGTNNEFGFDYLRDNMVVRQEHMVQRGHHFAIVDEVDSILVDEARTPLIISGPAEESTDKYYKAYQVSLQLKGRRITESDEIDAKHKSINLGEGYDYLADEKAKSISMTEPGEEKAAKLFGVANLHDMDTIEYRHHILQSLRAKEFFKVDVDYVARDGQVIIVDEFTGRLMPGRRWSDGLHQAVEAMEGIKIERENQTLATITFQNYFRMYEKLSGMTGTAFTEANEFKQIYNLDVVVMAPNRKVLRTNYADCIYKTAREKFNAVVNEIDEIHKLGRPVLVGTISIEKSEMLSRMLKQKGIPHQVLNAKYHETEATIIAQAGRFKAVTIATNMAGRGTDILLGGNAEYLAKSLAEQKLKDIKDEEKQQQMEEMVKKFLDQYRAQVKEERQKVTEIGGLHVLGTERHESRRIDNQLRGRQGRQGDPGSSRFYVSFDDDLVRLFAADRMGLIDKLWQEEGMMIDHPLMSRVIETAQKRVENHNFEIRKHLLEYDNVMNRQREVVYGLRREILESEDIKNLVLEGIDQESVRIIDQYFIGEQEEVGSDIEGLAVYLKSTFDLDITSQKEQWKTSPKELAKESLKKLFIDAYEAKERDISAEHLRHLERMVSLHTIDAKWKDHLYAMDQLKEGIGLRSFGQRDPLVEYKREGFGMFEVMYHSIFEEIIGVLFKLQPAQKAMELKSVFGSVPQKLVHEEISNMSQVVRNNQPAPEAMASVPQAPRASSSAPVHNDGPKVGRNDPCPCGSGKKYKKCCGS
jgi:preprotein translocase subunit SecA